jgi:predicted nucleic acid-binding protein
LKSRILVDTTIWIEFFRGKSKIADHLEMLLTENAVWMCGVVVFEVFQGIKSEGEQNKILSILASLPYVEMTKKLWQSAAELSILLKKNGVILPLSDVFIAAIAIEKDLSIYTLDHHFTQIPNLKLYKE